MKNILTVILFFSLSVFVAQVDPLDSNNKDILNEEEAKYFNSLFVDLDSTIRFKNDKIIFVANQKKPTSISKKEFFDTYIEPVKKINKNPNVSIISLDKADKEKSGGYDMIFLSPSGALTDKQRNKIFKELAEIQLYGKKRE